MHNFIKVSIPFKKDRFFPKYNQNRDFKREGLTNRQQDLIELIKRYVEINQEEMAEELNVSRYTVMRELKALEEQDIIIHEGSNKTGIWKVKDK